MRYLLITEPYPHLPHSWQLTAWSKREISNLISKVDEFMDEKNITGIFVFCAELDQKTAELISKLAGARGFYKVIELLEKPLSYYSMRDLVRHFVHYGHELDLMVVLTAKEDVSVLTEYYMKSVLKKQVTCWNKERKIDQGWLIDPVRESIKLF